MHSKKLYKNFVEVSRVQSIFIEFSGINLVPSSLYLFKVNKRNTSVKYTQN